MRALVAAGVDVVRLNFSHDTAAEHSQRIDMLRATAHDLGRTVGVMADLQGPKIRIGKFASGPVQIKANQDFILDAACTAWNAVLDTPWRIMSIGLRDWARTGQR